MEGGLISCLEKFSALMEFKSKHSDDGRQAQYMVLRKKTMQDQKVFPKLQITVIKLTQKNKQKSKIKFILLNNFVENQKYLTNVQ